MLKENKKNYYQNLGVLGIIVTLFALFAGTSVQNAKNSEAMVNPTPTPKKTTKTTVSPTPKKTSNSNKSTNSNSKSTNSNKTSSNSNKSTANSNKKSNSNSKTSANSNKSASNSSKTNSNSSKTGNTSSKTNSNSSKTASNSSKTGNSSSKTNSNSNKSTSNSSKTTSNSNKSTSNSSKTTTTVSYPQVIVTSISARVRSQANSSASEVRRVKLGSVLKVSGKNSGWYQVQLPSTGKTSTGWLSISSADDFDSANREEIYRQVADKYYKDEMDFNTASELYDFLNRAVNELKTKSASDLELKSLLSLRAALKSIPMDNITKSQKDFLKTTETKIIYSEPAGEWFVRSELFWDLHKKYKDTANAEKLAWVATKNPLAGECEGYVNCYLFILRATDGEYLSLYPSGENASEALKNITNMLEPIMQDLQEKSVYNGPTDVSDRAEFNRLISELRSILSKMPSTDKDKAIQQLEAIAEAFR